MTFLQVIAKVVGISLLLVLGMGATVLSRAGIQRLRLEFRDRMEVAVPSLTVLGGVLLLNGLLRTFAEEVSWLVGLNITGQIHQLEGDFVFHLQQLIGPAFTSVFSFFYVYGYVVLLVFPLVAYLTLQRLDAFHELVSAYAINYVVGLVCYVAFIAYGPRNLIPELVTEPMYVQYPQFRLLTSQINQHTNVFPSLHTSLSATVMLSAWRTRDQIPRWLPIAWLLGVGVMIATMYLGIHWLIDVIAGLALGAASMQLGSWLHEREYITRLGSSIDTRVRAVVKKS